MPSSTQEMLVFASPTSTTQPLTRPAPKHEHTDGEANTRRGEFHDQGGAEWMVIWRSLWGHNDTPCRRPAPGRRIGSPGSGRSRCVIGGISYYLLVIVFF
jgi:hypothetical protein